MSILTAKRGLLAENALLSGPGVASTLMEGPEARQV